MIRSAKSGLGGLAGMTVPAMRGTLRGGLRVVGGLREAGPATDDFCGEVNVADASSSSAALRKSNSY